MKTKICLISFLFAVSSPAWATLSFGTLSGGSALGPIPDNNTIGLTESYTVSGMDPKISALTLTVQLQGGSPTDLSAYLRLGNASGSPAYVLTSLVQSQTLSASSPTTFSINFSTSGFQSTFNELNPNNSWTLFFADTVNGDTTTLNGWSLDITAVPEPANVALAIFGAGFVGIGVARAYRGLRKIGETNSPAGCI